MKAPVLHIFYRFSAVWEKYVFIYNPCYPFNATNGCTNVAVSHIYVELCILHTYSYMIGHAKINHVSANYIYVAIF